MILEKSKRGNMYIQRAIEPVIQKMVNTFKVVLLTGARQVGKSTTLSHMFSSQDYEYVSLDDFNELQIAKSNPKAFF
ncbi:MAG TPA: AAA family ATPase, partial [Anaerolineaceae bacterium]|nr:AAA family ATPase [Anaerolineaceae bacterium]